MKFFIQLSAIFCLWLSTSKAQVLLYESFESSAFPPTGWTITNGGSGNMWSQNTSASYASAGSKSMVYLFTSTAPASAWAFTPSIALDSADSVTITFDQRVGLPNLSEALKVTVGLAADIASQTTVLYNNNNLTNTLYTPRSATFIAPAAGNYFFAFNCYSVADKYRLYIDNIRIAKPITTNIKLQSLTVIPDGCLHTNSEPIAITVKNTGIDTIHQYTAQYSINGNTFISENVTTSIAPNTSSSYTFSALANLSATGTYTINANVLLLNDGDPYDDSLVATTEHIQSGQFVKSFNGNTVIPDNSTTGAIAPITFCGLPTVLDGVSLIVDYVTIDSITHPWISDLALYLISPFNDSILLSANNGGDASNIINVVFTDTAQTNINSINSGGITAGYYHTESLQGLDFFNNYQDFNGIWKLRVKDIVAGDVGKICKWTLALKLETFVPETAQNDAIKIYPNPATETLNISNLTEKVSLQLYDVLGCLVLETETQSNTAISVTGFKPGIYVLTIQGNNTKSINRLVISK